MDTAFIAFATILREIYKYPAQTIHFATGLFPRGGSPQNLLAKTPATARNSSGCWCFRYLWMFSLTVLSNELQLFVRRVLIRIRIFATKAIYRGTHSQHKRAKQNSSFSPVRPNIQYKA